jgi:Notch-like protein
MEFGVPSTRDGRATNPSPQDQGMTPSECDSPIPEVCDGQDNDCDTLVDEGVQNQCETCGPEPEEVCNGVDDDCNGVIDDGCPCNPGMTEDCGSDLGACEAGRRMCNDEGIWEPCSGVGPERESCDAEDNDCDGQIDEELVRSCGSNIGVCRVGVERCQQGQWPNACEGETPPTEEVCNEQDDDCDGQLDEEIVLMATTCGVGACENDGRMECQDGQVADTCRPGAPTIEICDGQDNDCDGQTDEDIAPVPTNCGRGVCAATGQGECRNGRIVDTCSPNDAGPEICDGQDNDCDGQTDENVASVNIQCGIGACRAMGLRVCRNGRLVDTCSPNAAAPEVCDGQDNDCGVGACLAMGLRVCRNGRFANECVPRSPANETCDGVDNDCDNQADEGFNLGARCTVGVGACRAGGTRVCGANGDQSRCNAVARAPGNEGGEAGVCDRIDNDCDGTIDEGVGSLEDWSNPANCDGVDNDCDGNTDESYENCLYLGVFVGHISCVNGVITGGCAVR